MANKLEDGPYAGFEYYGRVIPIAEFFESLRDPKTGKHEYGYCSYMAPLVTGLPIAELPSVNAAP